MKKVYSLIMIIILVIICPSCKGNNCSNLEDPNENDDKKNTNGLIDLNDLYEKNGELASNYFLGWGTRTLKYELIIFETENASQFETESFSACFSDDVEKILYVKYEREELAPYIVAMQYKSIESAKTSILLSDSYYMRYENIVAARMSGSYLLLYGEYKEIDGYMLNLDGDSLLFDDLCYTRKDIIIPQGVKYVPAFALASTIVKTIKCNLELEVLCSYSLSTTYSLEKIELNDGLKEIGEYCFDVHNLEYIVIPNSVEIIGEKAFKNVTIFCEVDKKPSGWHYNFALNNCEVYWKGTWEYVNGVPQPIAEEI